MVKSLWTCHKPIKFSIGKKLFTVRQCLMSDNHKSSWDLLLDFSIWEQGYLKPGNDFNPLSTIKITNRSWTHRTNICHGTLTCLSALGAEKKKLTQDPENVIVTYIFVSLAPPHIYDGLICPLGFKGLIGNSLFCTNTTAHLPWIVPEIFWPVLSWTWIFLSSQLKEITQVIV